jgi:hypothetical protein
MLTMTLGRMPEIYCEKHYAESVEMHTKNGVELRLSRFKFEHLKKRMLQIILKPKNPSKTMCLLCFLTTIQKILF